MDSEPEDWTRVPKVFYPSTACTCSYQVLQVLAPENAKLPAAAHTGLRDCGHRILQFQLSYPWQRLLGSHSPHHCIENYWPRTSLPPKLNHALRTNLSYGGPSHQTLANSEKFKEWTLKISLVFAGSHWALRSRYHCWRTHPHFLVLYRRLSHRHLCLFLCMFFCAFRFS